MRKALAVIVLFSVVLSVGYSAGLAKPGVPSPGHNLVSTHYDGDPMRDHNASWQNGTGPGYLRTSRKTESKITIVFAGLIYLRHKEGPTEKGLFTACILKSIPGHTFQLLGDIRPRACPTRKNWDLHVLKGDSGTPKGGAYPDVVKPFDRKSRTHPSYDYQWIVDFDQLYSGGYDVDDDGLGPVVRIPAGRFYTLCRTVRLSHKKGDDDQGQYGFMADIMGVDIILEPGEKLVLRSGSCDIIDPLLYQPGTRYIVFANLPPSDRFSAHHSVVRKRRERESGPPTHFLNYYFVVRKKYEDRYDFGLMETSVACPLPFKLKQLLKRGVTKSPPPYYCGVGGGGG